MNDNVPSHRDNEVPEWPVEVRAWLEKQSSEEAAEITTVWELAAHARLFDPPCEPDAGRFERMRTEVKKVARASAPVRRGSMTAVRTLHPRTFRAAAAVLLFLIAGSIWMARPVIHEAPLGKQLAVHLPDGTEVSLNSGSRLSHNRLFGRIHRNVVLRGEAFFDVTSDEKPFSVETFNGKVVVLGTRFNVRAWHSDDEPETVVLLEEGSVRFVSHLDEDNPVTLKPGEMSRIAGPTAAPTAPEVVDIDLRLSWRTGGLIFVDQTMGVAVDEIRRRFDIDIKLVPDSLRRERISLVLNDARSVREVLDTIAEVRGYTIERAGENYRLSKP